MKRTATTLIISLLFVGLAFGAKEKKKPGQKVYQSDMPAYVIYDSKGEMVTFSKMVEELSKHEICLFGEIHDDPVTHWLERMVAQALVDEKGSSMVMGGEMWEADQQLLMDELMIHDLIDRKTYTESAKNWPNFRDYKPLLQIALQNKLTFVCTNIPRRYANVIYKKGFSYLDSLPEAAYQYLPPRPIHFNLEQPAYANMVSLFAPSGDDTTPTISAPSEMMKYEGADLVRAQAIKDATMAYNILKYWEKGKYFLHFNGTYHSKFYDSLYYYLKYYRPDVDIVTIHTWRVGDVMSLPEGERAADFNIMIPNTMPKSYE